MQCGMRKSVQLGHGRTIFPSITARKFFTPAIAHSLTTASDCPYAFECRHPVPSPPTSASNLRRLNGPERPRQEVIRSLWLVLARRANAPWRCTAHYCDDQAPLRSLFIEKGFVRPCLFPGPSLPFPLVKVSSLISDSLWQVRCDGLPPMPSPECTTYIPMHRCAELTAGGPAKQSGSPKRHLAGLRKSPTTGGRGCHRFFFDAV